jgi:hypothetical protein
MSGSLKQIHGFTDNAFALRPAVPFKPENIQLGEYTFLPWVRTGLAAGIVGPAPGQVRAQVAVSIDVQDDAGTPPVTVSKTLTVRGPGDVLGFDVSQIVRRHPAPGTPNAEDTFLVHVEFNRPDFPWLFSPAAPAGQQLVPWLALIVLRQSVASIQQGGRGLPPVVITQRGELTSLEQSWAWAHAQVVGPPDSGPTVSDRLSDQYRDVNLSRLLCPQRLTPNTAYVACIVPAFEVGAHAGLGQSGGGLGPAWTRTPGDDAQEFRLPVYDRWTFATAEDGDFASLAGKLTGVPAPWNVGRRTLETSHPGGGVSDLGVGDPGERQVIRCALVAPSTVVKPQGAPDEDATWNAAKTEELRTQLNLPDDLATRTGGVEDLPIVGPQIYARFQRGQNRVLGTPPGDWFDELNLLPTRRVTAGVGTRVVQKDREPLMQAAWAQVGELEAANRDVRRAQFARFVGASLHRRHLSALHVGDLAQVTRGVHGKVRVDAASLTVRGTAAASAVAPAALTGAFRRLTSPRGSLSRYAVAADVAALKQIVAIGSAFRDFRRAYQEPDGIATLSASAIAGVPAAVASNVLGVAEAGALAALTARCATFAKVPSSADRLLSDPATWKPTKTTFDLGSIAAERALNIVHGVMPSNIAAHPSRGESLAPLLVGIANSGAPAARSAKESLRHIATRLRLPGGGGAAGGAALPAALDRFESSTSRQLAITLATTRAVTAGSFVTALSQLVRGTGVLDMPLTPNRAALTLDRAAFLTQIHSRNTVTKLVKARIAAMPAWLAPDWFDDGLVRPIMAAPVFTRPMYEALDAYNRDWLVPGLSRVAQSDFVTLLETNPEFSEAFLAGLSDEMGRQLLFRGFPTDQRGTYFRRFWTADVDELGQDLHRFTRTPLGTHLSVATGSTAALVFVVRGELVRRYPDAITLGMRAGSLDSTGHPVFIDPASDKTALARIVFHAQLPPDILLVGFALTEADIVPNRWWFVIAEHPTAPRFGAPPPRFGLPAHAGLVAQQLLHDPVRAAFEASKLVASTKVGA